MRSAISSMLTVVTRCVFSKRVGSSSYYSIEQVSPGYRLILQSLFLLLLLVISTTTGASNTDQDNDGIADLEDNCIYKPNGALIPDAGGHVQRDTDGDGYGNLCDGDLNNDGAVNFADLGILKSVFFTADPDADLDGNAAVNFADLGILKSLFFAEPGPSGLHLETLTTSSVLSDNDNSYPTSRVVQIDVQRAEHVEIDNATVSITSASQGYDSGEQQLVFGSLYYLWETADLPPADDYNVRVTIVTKDSQTLVDESLVVALETNTPVINKLVSEIDLSVPSVGIPVQFQRTYLLDSDFEGPLGYGWTHNYRMRLVIPTALLPAPSGELSGELLPVLPPVQVFNGDGTGSWFMPNQDGSYSAPKGDFRTLVHLDNGVYSLRSKQGATHYFSSNGKLFRVADRNSNAVTLQYDSNDSLVSITDASGQITTIAYDTNNRISTLTDPVARTATYTYDGAGNLTSVTDFGGNTTDYSYDGQHNLTTITDPLGKRTFFTIDGEDRLQSVSGEGGQNQLSLQYGVPAADRMTVTDALGNQTILTFDNNASVTRVVDPNGNITQMAYDADLNLASLTDPNGGQNTFTYDARGNVLTVTDAQGNSTSLTYDAEFNQVTNLTDARSNTTTFGFDTRGNLTTTTYPNGSSETYTYDSIGNLATQTDRKNQTIAFSYNSRGQLTQKTFPDSSTDGFAYNSVGNLASATDTNGTISFAYDSLDRLVQVTYPGAEVVAYSYDAASNRTQLVYPNGKTLNYSYDNLNRLTQISEAGQMVASYTYDDLSRVIRRDLQNGTYSTYSYDSAGQLLELFNRKSTTEIISSFIYTHDNIGNRLTKTTQEGTTQYTYDAISQLTRVVLPDSSTSNYNLDAAGNRTSVADGNGSTSYTSNSLNQYSIVGGDTYSYDANGSITSKTTSTGTTSYTYDFENQLVQAVTPTETVSYDYDSLGRRISKTTSTATTWFLHDGFQVLLEKGATEGVQAIYTFGIGIDEMLVMQRGSADYFYTEDGLRSVTNLTDSEQSVVETYTYDVYGKPGTMSLVGNPYLYTSREYESEIGLYYSRMRYYDPTIGRFSSADPIGYFAGINLYTYVSNNPVNFTDPYGLRPIKIWPNKIPGIYRTYPVGLSGSFGRLVRGTFRGTLRALGPVGKIKDAWDLGWNAGDLFMALPLAPEGESLRKWWLRFSAGGPIIPPRSGAAGNGGGVGDGGSTCQEPDPAMCLDPCALGECICSESATNMCVADPSFVQVPQKLQIANINTWLADTQRDVLQQGRQSLAAKILIPYNDALIRADVPIFGLAFGEGFKEYRLEYGEGTASDEWVTLTTSSTPQSKPVTSNDLNDSLGITIQGNLATWDTGLTNYSYPATHPKGHPVDLNGPYTLRLIVTGNDGQTVEDRVSVNVANVIPNAWGGIARSKDNNAAISVPEQALRDIFRLISIQPTNTMPAKAPAGRQLVGDVYEVRDPTERFTKAAVLQLAYTDTGLVSVDASRMGIYGYNDKARTWEHLPSYRLEGESAVKTKVRSLHPFYALMTSNDIALGSRLDQPTTGGLAISKVSAPEAGGQILVRDTFEKDTGDWSNRDNEVGGSVALDDTQSHKGGRVLKISNTEAGGNFAANVVSTPFDARDYPIVEFDYRVPAEVKTNFLVKVAGRWYEIGFTDDKKDLQAKNVNIAHIGDIEGVVADDRWRTARFNLYNMLRTRTGRTVVDEMIMADWDVTGFMRLQFGANRKDATYFIDNFSIGRDPRAGLRMVEERLLIDDFDQEQDFNYLNGKTSTFSDGVDGQLEVGFVSEFTFGSGESLKLTYDVTQPNSYAGYISELQGLDLRDYQALELSVRGSREMTEAVVVFKDVYGQESKVALKYYLPERIDEQEWINVKLPLVAFTGAIDWSKIELMSLSFSHELAATGTLLVDNIALSKTLDSLLVDDFRRQDKINRLGDKHTIFVAGTAAINGERMMNSPNAVYSLSYGGNIGDPIPGRLGQSHVGWQTGLGGIDCSGCGALSFRIRGSRGGEKPNIYLDDGNFRWGLDIEKYAEVTTQWQDVTLPLDDFAGFGVDLTHLSELLMFFEWGEMSGTIYLDDIRFGDASKHFQ